MGEIILRPAIALDAEMVFEWRNAVEIRQYFFDPRPLNKVEHIRWFEESLEKPDRQLLIAELNKEPIGVLRYDFFQSQAEIDIYLCPGLVGKGFGTNVLLAGTEWVKTHFPKIKIFRAKIIADNVASIRAFEKAGFQVKNHVYEKNISVESK